VTTVTLCASPEEQPDPFRKGQKVFFQDISGRPVRAIIDGVVGPMWRKLHITAILDKRHKYGDTFTTSTDWLTPRTR
jgi:hypothetical protein